MTFITTVFFDKNQSIYHYVSKQRLDFSWRQLYDIHFTNQTQNAQLVRQKRVQEKYFSQMPSLRHPLLPPTLPRPIHAYNMSHSLQTITPYSHKKRVELHGSRQPRPQITLLTDTQQCFFKLLYEVKEVFHVRVYNGSDSSSIKLFSISNSKKWSQKWLQTIVRGDFIDAFKPDRHLACEAHMCVTVSRPVFPFAPCKIVSFQQ